MHRGSILLIDKTPSRNIIMTLGSQDRTIFIYNLSTTVPKLFMKNTFSEQPVTFSLHPNGLNVAIGNNDLIAFKDSLRVYAITSNEFLLVIHDTTKTPSSVKYFPKGNYLYTHQAIQNSCQIQIL